MKANQTLASNTMACSVLQQISDTVTNVVSQTLPVSLTSQINELTQHMQELKNPRADPQSMQTEVSRPRESLKTYLVAPEPPYQQYVEDYLDDSLLKKTTGFLADMIQQNRFSQEHGHSVLSFGEPYVYNGSKGDRAPEPIPDVLKDVIGTFSTKLNLKDAPNSVLINYYPPKTEDSSADDAQASYLPFHSDDEPSIDAQSSIVTLSLGSTRTLVFKATHNSTQPDKTLTPSHNSLYTMTRTSQGWFKHGIEPTMSNEGRFSLTFRSVSKNHMRSVLVMGDSNTSNIKFGSGAGTVGATYPGKREKAAKISSINPDLCVGYSNLVLVCGTNNLRNGSIRDESDIPELVELYRVKLARIKQLSPKMKIFIVPVLPTRNTRMNQSITRFNDMLGDMLYHCYPDIWFPGVHSFLDKQNLLSLKLCRDKDEIHLGDKGIAQFVRCMKLWIFEREVCERRLNRSSRQVSSQRTGSTAPAHAD